MIKNAILSNQFLNRLRIEFRIDRVEYLKLCDSLIQLKKEWRGAKDVDKRLAQELFGIPIVVKGAADHARQANLPSAGELTEMAIVLEGIILECLDS